MKCSGADQPHSNRSDHMLTRWQKARFVLNARARDR
jgi:hypothetical protein